MATGVIAGFFREREAVVNWSARMKKRPTGSRRAFFAPEVRSEGPSKKPAPKTLVHDAIVDLF
jgi:hypothetical protein